jgi:hypothetical protein
VSEGDALLVRGDANAKSNDGPNTALCTLFLIGKMTNKTAKER